MRVSGLTSTLLVFIIRCFSVVIHVLHAVWTRLEGGGRRRQLAGCHRKWHAASIVTRRKFLRPTPCSWHFVLMKYLFLSCLLPAKNPYFGRIVYRLTFSKCLLNNLLGNSFKCHWQGTICASFKTNKIICGIWHRIKKILHRNSQWTEAKQNFKIRLSCNLRALTFG